MDSKLEGKRIVVIDDEFAHRKLLGLIFSKVGATVQTAEGYTSGMELLENSDPDLMLIDVMMPDVDGLTLCHQVRLESNVPIIIISAKKQPEDIVAGLRAGADDYVVKPYDFKVLVERATAVLRRATNGRYAPKESTFKDDNLIIDLPNRLVIVDERLVHLDDIEFALLAFLVRNANQTCTFADLLTNVWGKDCFHNPEYIHAYIWRLRHKIELNPYLPAYIVADNDTGFRFAYSES
jgi:DNA-binding response OmpR family regulator